jgi:tetratricopeptide (TPR) repeat protein
MGKRKGKAGRGQQSIQADPQELQRNFQQAVAYFQAGRLDEADTFCRKILKQAPGLPDVLHFRGLIACRSGDPRRGAKLIREAVAANPDSPDYRVNLGNAYREMGRADDAIKQYKAALKIKPDIPELRNGLGTMYKDKGDEAAAEREFQQAIKLRPDFAQAHYNLAALCTEQERNGLAINHYREAIRNDSGFTDAYVALAQLYNKLRITEKAQSLFEEAMRHRPDNHGLMMEYASCLQDAGRSEEALEIATRALELAPQDDLPSMTSMSLLLLNAGQHDEALEYSRKILEIRPDAVGVLENIANSRKFQQDDPEIAEMERFLEMEGLEDETSAMLHFSLGKVYNDCKLYDDAFRHYLNGNGIKRQSIEYDRQKEEEYFDRLIGFFDQQFFAQRPWPGMESELPIFIVGMPRSGTTLTEQIISSHPQVFGAGELGDMARITSHLTSLAGKGSQYPDSLLQLDGDVLSAVTNRFLENLSAYDPEARHITDKMPHNFAQLGTIAYLLPRARVVHCRRNPLDNCVSIFFQNFGSGHPYKWGLEDLGHYYRLYERLMEHWKQMLPIPMFEVQYEEMVENQEALSRRLIEFCGLEWDDSCLEFHRSSRAVKTASHWQVRQPIYKSSTERWRLYEKHLEPLQKGLEEGQREG